MMNSIGARNQMAVAYAKKPFPHIPSQIQKAKHKTQPHATPQRRNENRKPFFLLFFLFYRCAVASLREPSLFLLLCLTPCIRSVAA